MSDILKAVKDLLNKAQGYTQHTASGGPAEAVQHNVEGAPKYNESKTEKNEANSGTHPKAGGQCGSSSRMDSGEGFDDDPSEGNIETPKGSGGRAKVARPETIKHEGGGVGPNEPGTATTSQKSESDPDLVKGENPFEKKEDDKDDKDEDKEEKAEKSEGKEEEKEDEDDAEKSMDDENVYLDIDEFAAEIVNKAVEILDKKYAEHFEKSLQKSEETEYVEAGLAKSVLATVERLEEVEKAIVNIANTMNVRKSLLKSADSIKGIDNPSLSKSQLSKSEISSRLLDMSLAGQVDTNTVLRFDAVGDVSILPESIRTKLGIE